MKTIDLVNKNLAKRYRKEKLFRAYGLASIGFGLLCLVLLFSDIIGKGYKAFVQTNIQIEVNFDAGYLGITDTTNTEQMFAANFEGLVKKSLREMFLIKKRSDKRLAYSLVSTDSGYQLHDLLVANPAWLGTTKKVWLLADDDLDTYYKSVDNLNGAFTGRMQEQQLVWIKNLLDNDALQLQFNMNFFNLGDSTEPELAGIRAALMGSLFTLMVTMVLSFPVGVAAAIYLEEYAPRNRFTDIIEVNINNLAAVPSIIFGLLGAAIFLGFFGMHRSLPLVGGLVLTLMTLPTIIITSRAAIKAVPPSIREAAMSIGASKMQVVLHHVLPLAMPGMLTGAIIGLAQALGETAPLLLIGMVAFIVDIPSGVTDPATALPVQIYLWSDRPERSFAELTSAAIMVLLGVLIVMNALAVLLRKKLERRW
tara:strand:- start:1247 stop:2515 length:1269 start_codon:yes stop_codon:yes gene_type:complete